MDVLSLVASFCSVGQTKILVGEVFCVYWFAFFCNFFMFLTLLFFLCEIFIRVDMLVLLFWSLDNSDFFISRFFLACLQKRCLTVHPNATLIYIKSCLVWLDIIVSVPCDFFNISGTSVNPRKPLAWTITLFDYSGTVFSFALALGCIYVLFRFS